MHYAVYFPLLFPLLLSLGARGVALRVPPAQATWLLSIGGLLAALATGWSLTLLAFTLVGRHPVLADRAGWSGAALDQASPVAIPVGAAAAVLLVVAGVRAMQVAVRRAFALRDAHRMAATLAGPELELAVVDDSEYLAYAVPGRPGRIVLSSALIKSLSDEQRRIVLAHERAHLEYHHHRHHTAALLAFAVHPLLWRLPEAVALATERWADERAAAGVLQRDAVARTLFQVATGGRSRARSTISLAATATAMNLRIMALLAPAPRSSTLRFLLIAVVLVAPAAAGLEAALDIERLFEHAQHAFAGLHR